MIVPGIGPLDAMNELEAHQNRGRALRVLNDGRASWFTQTGVNKRYQGMGYGEPPPQAECW
jgi:hypothetical protein